MAEVRRKLAVYHSIGVRASVLDARALAQEEPNLRPGLAGGLLVPDDAVVYPPCAARYQLVAGRLRRVLGHGVHQQQCIVVGWGLVVGRVDYPARAGRLFDAEESL